MCQLISGEAAAVVVVDATVDAHVTFHPCDFGSMCALLQAGGALAT